MVFHGDLFDTHPTFIHLRSTLLDFYAGHPVTEIPIIALEHVVSITHAPTDPTNPDKLPRVHFRVFTLKLLPSRRFELTEMGPRIDWSVRRVQAADDEVMKVALKRAKVAKSDVEKGLGKKRKNIETDDLGDKVGKIHLAKQDLGKMQGRKMKGLKVRKEKTKGEAEGGRMDEGTGGEAEE
jgi:ribosome production factor 2